MSKMRDEMENLYKKFNDFEILYEEDKKKWNIRTQRMQSKKMQSNEISECDEPTSSVVKKSDLIVEEGDHGQHAIQRANSYTGAETK